MRRPALAGCCALAAAALLYMPAFAKGDTPGRYSMSPTEGGGFARLDTTTGQMSLCQRTERDWSCREMAEPAKGLSDEVERLRAENQRLKAEMRQMEDILLGDKRAEARPGPETGRSGFEFKLPSEQDIDSALSYAQRMLRKFREKMRELEAETKGTPL